jgi:hypothetical protein
VISKSVVGIFVARPHRLALLDSSALPAAALFATLGRRRNSKSLGRSLSIAFAVALMLSVPASRSWADGGAGGAGSTAGGPGNGGAGGAAGTGFVGNAGTDGSSAPLYAGGGGGGGAGGGAGGAGGTSPFAPPSHRLSSRLAPMTAAHRQALEVEAGAKRRLADEYDAARSVVKLPRSGTIYLALPSRTLSRLQPISAYPASTSTKLVKSGKLRSAIPPSYAALSTPPSLPARNRRRRVVERPSLPPR